jgi:hypothetical protein
MPAMRDYANDKSIVETKEEIKIYLLFLLLAAIKNFLTDFYTDLPEGGKAFKYSKQLVCTNLSLNLRRYF